MTPGLTIYRGLVIPRCLSQAFDRVDRHRRGFITVLDLAFALRSVGLPVEEVAVRTMMSK